MNKERAAGLVRDFGAEIMKVQKGVIDTTEHSRARAMVLTKLDEAFLWYTKAATVDPKPEVSGD